MKKLLLIVAVVAVLGYFILYQGIWVWVVENTDVPPDKMLVLVAKTGKEMPPGKIIAGPGEKGVLLEPLGTGRHFINPFFYERQLHDQVVVGAGHALVKKRPAQPCVGGATPLSWKRMCITRLISTCCMTRCAKSSRSPRAGALTMG